MSAAMGGNFWSGFAAGAIGAGSLSGGVGSVVSGGKFWDGFRNGAISASLNHVADMIVQKVKTIRSTREALKHYFEGKGESVKLHPDVKKALLGSKKFIRKFLLMLFDI